MSFNEIFIEWNLLDWFIKCSFSCTQRVQNWGGHNALKVSEYRTPQNPRTFRSSSQNLLSGQLKFIVKLLPCHAMANLQHNWKKWYCKKWNFWKNQLKGFFFFQIYHPKLMSQKYNFEFSLTLLCLLTQLWGWNFHFSLILNLNFWGVASTFQGIVPGGPWPPQNFRIY